VRQTLRLLRSTLPSSISLDAQWLDATRRAPRPWVMADPVQLEQILFNLCINARDAMAGVGRITVRLESGRSRAGCALRAACRSRGPGCPAGGGRRHGHRARVLDRIFDPFFSTKAPAAAPAWGWRWCTASCTTTRAPAGGHRAERRLALHGAAAGGRGDADAPQAAPVSGRVQQPLPAGRLLVVEDDAQVGPYLQEQLAAWGLEVTLVPDPEQALRWLEQPANQADIVLTDLTMPGMNGSELAQAVQRLRPGLPVMLSPATAANSTKPACTRAASPACCASRWTRGSCGRTQRAAANSAWSDGRDRDRAGSTGRDPGRRRPLMTPARRHARGGR
jgi:CheY-like chemotaxis protein